MKLKSKKIILLFIISLVMILGLATIVNAADEDFKFSETKKNVYLNGTGYLSYENKPIGETITWSSSNDSIASVDSNGKVTGKAIGEVTITASAGTKTATCIVNVVYYTLKITPSFEDIHISGLNLILQEHESESIKAYVKDYKNETISNANITWTSSDSSVATVDNTGNLKAKKVGKTTITAKASGVENTCEINVLAAPVYTDFSNAIYETKFENLWSETLKITSIKPDDDYNNVYYYIITPNNKKPNVKYTEHGLVDTEGTSSIEYFNVNAKENYIYSRKFEKYEELNQDLYIWIIQQKYLGSENYYYNENGKSIMYSTKFVVEGKKLGRVKLPQLNLILQSFSVGVWKGTKETNKSTWLRFNYPTATAKRKFTLKIGRVTDNAILKKIQKNDYSGITELLAYAKKSDAVYNKQLTTTSEGFYSNNDSALFDGRKLLKNKAYYYVYAQLDDENGKYYPIEGVTLAQAYLSSTNNTNWDLWAYTSGDFKWDNLTSTYSLPKTTTKTNTPKKLPYTGAATIGLVIVAMTGTAVFFKVKNNKYKGI